MDSMQNAPICPNGEHQWVDYQCVYCGAQKPEALDEIFQELLALSSDMSLYEIGLREKRARKLGEILNQWGGFPLMVSMCEAVGAVNLLSGRLVELWWHGIGTWRG